MAQYRAKTKKQLGKAPPVVLEGEGSIDSIAGIKKYDSNYVQLRGMRWGGIDLFIREDLLKRV